MNFLDAYDLTGQNDAPQSEPEQSLNEEVTQVIGQLSRLWGGFRKQSQNVIDNARRDFGDAVTQAQRELGKLTASQIAEASATPQASGSSTPSASGQRSIDETQHPEFSDAATLSSASSQPSSGSQSLLSRLQSALPPNVVSTVQSHIPESLRHARESIDFNQLRSTLSNEFERVQGITRAQAEEYVQKSEALLREAVKEASEVLKDAVKIIPPEDSGGPSGLVWDGTDMWSLPLDSSETSPPPSKSSQAKHGSVEAVASRAESLLRRLKHDPIITRHDPLSDPELKDFYSRWLASQEDSDEQGILVEKWSQRISGLLEEANSGEALKSTRDALVPSEITEQTFWTRFFFRTHQIEVEKEKRKALIEAAAEDEVFSWEDDDDETSAQPEPDQSLMPPRSSSGTPIHTQETSTTGVRDSEEGYDMISSGNVSPKPEPSSENAQEELDNDSDWE